jgi:hypothetical protein
MSNVANVALNPATGKWEATYKGRVLAKANSKDYVQTVILSGLSQKAKNANVTQVQFVKSAIMEDREDGEDGEASSYVPVPIHTVEKEFGINERFKIMTDYVDMVAKRNLASALITGEGGLGKTYTVMQSLANSGLQDLSCMEIGARFAGEKGFTVVKGYSSPRGLFTTLYENRNQIIVFDDCDSVLRDPNAVNLLKAALDSYDRRIITWNAQINENDGVERSFEFTGGIIFISNLPKSKIPQSIRSRAMCADVSMTRAECIDRMRVIVKSETFMPDFETEHKEEALEFVAENADNPLIVELNLRSLINVIKSRASKPDHWKRLGLYSMANAA